MREELVGTDHLPEEDAVFLFVVVVVVVVCEVGEKKKFKEVSISDLDSIERPQT